MAIHYLYCLRVRLKLEPMLTEVGVDSKFTLTYNLEEPFSVSDLMFTSLDCRRKLNCLEENQHMHELYTERSQLAAR